MRNRYQRFRELYGMGRRQMMRLGIDQFGNPRRGFGAGRGGNRGDKPGSGPAGNCICPNCGAKVSHIAGNPCNERECPKCNTIMTRE